MENQYHKIWVRSSNLLYHVVTTFYVLNMLLLLTKTYHLIGNSAIRSAVHFMRFPLRVALLIVALVYVLGLYDFKSIQQKQDTKAFNNLLYGLYIWIASIIFSFMGFGIAAFCAQYTSLFCTLLGYNHLRQSSTYPDPAVHASQHLWLGALLTMGGLFVSKFATVGLLLSFPLLAAALYYTRHGWDGIRNTSEE